MAEHAAGRNHRRPSQDEARAHPGSPPYKANVIENPHVSQSRRPSVRFADPPTLPTSSSSHVPSHFERERKPYSPFASESAIDDTPTPPPSLPSHSIVRERNRHTLLPSGAVRFQDGFGRVKPRTESIVDPALRPRRTHSTSGPHPTLVNVNSRGHQRGPQPGTQDHYRTAHRLSRQCGPSSCGRLTDPFRRSESDGLGYEPTLEPSSILKVETAFDISDARRYCEMDA